MNKTVKEKIISRLAEGNFVSGQELGEELGISRAAISKHMKAIVDMGLDVFSVTGKGYRLAEPLDLLDEFKINHFLNQSNLNPIVDVFGIIDSTNDYLLRKLPNSVNLGQVCVAEYQSSGRGRRGRKWISPFGANVYLSMYWNIEQGMSAAMGLNIVAALAVCSAIKKECNMTPQLKWPNDIYCEGVKLAGILIDLEGQALEPCHCVIGIGLNLNMPDSSGARVDQPWTAINKHISTKIDRNRLVAAIIEELSLRVSEHLKPERSDVVQEWNELDYYFNQPVKLISGKKEVIGISRGIDQQGALLLETAGELKTMYGGELSLRSAK